LRYTKSSGRKTFRREVRGTAEPSASLGMTKGRASPPFRFDGTDDKQQVPPLRSPGFPVELNGAGALHAPFPYRKAHTRSCPTQRGRKSGYASVGMTRLLGTDERRMDAVFRPLLTGARLLVKAGEASDYKVRLNRGVAISRVTIPKPDRKSRSMRIAVRPPSLRRMALKPCTA
jgi:hypothetical protein